MRYRLLGLIGYVIKLLLVLIHKGTFRHLLEKIWNCIRAGSLRVGNLVQDLLGDQVRKLENWLVLQIFHMRANWHFHVHSCGLQGYLRKNWSLAGKTWVLALAGGLSVGAGLLLVNAVDCLSVLVLDACFNGGLFYGFTFGSHCLYQYLSLVIRYFLVFSCHC